MKAAAHLFPSVVAVVLLAGSQAHAGLIFQSATAVVTSTSNNTSADGLEVDSTFYSAVNFQLTQTTQISAIGGIFGISLGLGNKEIFGAITAVSGPDATPADPTLATGVLASTLITLDFPFTSSETLSGSLDVVLGPGYYALVFGSGMFGATGSGAIVEDVTSPTFTGAVSTDGIPTYSIRQSDGTIFQQSPGARMFVEGSVVPEPSSLLMASLGLAGVGLVAARRRKS